MYEVSDGKTGHRLSKGMRQNPDGSSSYTAPPRKTDREVGQGGVSIADRNKEIQNLLDNPEATSVEPTPAPSPTPTPAPQRKRR